MQICCLLPIAQLVSLKGITTLLNSKSGFSPQGVAPLIDPCSFSYFIARSMLLCAKPSSMSTPNSMNRASFQCRLSVFSLGYHLAECHHVPLGQVPFRKNRNLVHFTDFNSLRSGLKSLRTSKLWMALDQVDSCRGHLSRCRPVTCSSGAIHLAKCMDLSTHPSNIPDWYLCVALPMLYSG